jgi:hypothetical protein
MISRVGLLASFAVIGFVIGTAQFASLRRNVARYIGGDARSAAIAFHVVRLLAATAAWIVVARVGRAPGLLAAFVGFLVSRPLFVARTTPKGKSP